MKKFLFLLLVAATTISADVSAQAPVQWRSQAMTIKTGAGIYSLPASSGTIKAADTLTNTDTNTVGYRVTYPYDVVITAKYALLSGFGRGTSKLQGTNDTTGAKDGWHTVTASKTHCVSCVDSTYTITNTATQYARFMIPKAAGYTYYRLLNLTDTTETLKVTADLHYGY